MLINWCYCFFIWSIFFYLCESHLNFRIMIGISIIFLLLKIESSLSNLIDIAFFRFLNVYNLKITAIHLFILVD